MNARGEAAGIIFTSSPSGEFVFHAAAFDEGGEQVRDLGTLPGRTGSEALGINRHRVIVGFSTSPDGSDEHAFLFRDGRMFDLDDLVEPTGLVVRVANAIDDDGIIVANATDAEGRQHSVALLPMKDDSH